MWKPSQPEQPASNPVPEPVRPAPPSSALESASRAGVTAGDQATISKGLFIKGEISGSESLFIDGKSRAASSSTAIASPLAGTAT